MKIEWQEDEFDIEEDFNDKKKGAKTDALEKYSDEMARDAVSNLFDEDEKDIPEEDGPVVTGFEKKKPRSEREITAGPRVKDVISGESAPPRKRDRTREANPVPKPAVRYAPPPPRERKTVRQAPVTIDIEDDFENDEMEADMDAFRKRYKSKSAEPQRKSDGGHAPEERRPAPHNPRFRYGEADAADEDEPISPLRWIFIASLVVVLCIAAFLAHRVSVLSGELAAAQLALDESPDAYEFTQKQLQIDQLTAQITEKDAEIAELEASGGNVNPGGADNPAFALDGTQNGTTAPVVTEEENPEAPPTDSQTYTVVRGDSFAKIAQQFYGNQRPSSIDKIMAANNMTEPNIQPGDILTIPPQ